MGEWIVAGLMLVFGTWASVVTAMWLDARDEVRALRQLLETEREKNRAKPFVWMSARLSDWN